VAIFTVGLAVWSLTTEILQQPSVQSWSWWVSIAVVALTFLALSVVQEPARIETLQLLTGLFVVAVMGLMGVVGIVQAVANIFTLFSDPSGSILGLARAYCLTWPISILAHIVVDPSTRRDWLWRPQWFLGRLFLSEVRGHISGLAWSSVPSRAFTAINSFGFILLVAFSVTIVALSTTDQPDPEQEPGQVTFPGWWFYAMGVLGVVALLGAAIKWRSVQVKIRRSMIDGPVTDDILLAWLKNANSKWDTQLLLTRLRHAPPGTLRSCSTALTDLAQALEHISRMVPSGASNRIPRGVWDAGEKYSKEGFRDWLEDYDSKHKGRLCWLASHHRDAIAHTLERATSIPTH
jgi:hypothetical protein